MQILRTIKLSVTFDVDELVVASDSVVYALARSTFGQVIPATGAESAESNRETLIFSRDTTSWKIGRHLFNEPA